MGLDFFRRAVAMQRQYAAGRRITNTIQTNGTLLDDEWGRFLAEGGWLVGLSLDGPPEIHNANRPDAAGGGSFDAVKRGLDVLLKHNVEFNILASVTPASTAEPLKVYEFIKSTGAKFVQFMPIVERLPDAAARELGLQLAVGTRAGQEAAAAGLTPWSVEPEAYGRFLCTIFDHWVRRDVGEFFVMNFEWAFAGFMGLSPGVCHWMPVCGHSLIVEHNGDIYACDHYVYPEYRLGNILSGDLQQMAQSQAQKTFGLAKSQALPQYCRDCPVLPGCWGECPKRRFALTPDGQAGLNYLCPAYRKFLLHAAPYFSAMARLKNLGQPVSKIMEYDVRVV